MNECVSVFDAHHFKIAPAGEKSWNFGGVLRNLGPTIFHTTPPQGGGGMKCGQGSPGLTRRCALDPLNILNIRTLFACQQPANMRE